MIVEMPRRVTVVFGCLVAATCVTWWLGSESTWAGDGFGVAAALTIVIAFAKILFIGRDFMELRTAPPILRIMFTTWVGVFAAAAIGLVVL